MKFRTLISVLLIACGLREMHGAAGPSSILPLSLLTIDSIQLEGTEVVVTAQVSAEFKRVTLESRPRTDGGNWEPVATQRLIESSTQVRFVTFRVPRSAQMELLRLRGDTAEVLPAAFYQGTNSFGVPTNSGDPATAGGGVAATTPTGAQQKDGATALAPSADMRGVVESDIWKIDGDTLYFFNQYRGLQVIDIKQPDSPVVRGTYDLPAAGEQMYLFDASHVILLARDQCGGWSPSGESQVMLLEITAGQPKAVGQLSVAGYIKESRLVGTALYVVSERYRPIRILDSKGNSQELWEWGSQITSFDLSRFSEPKEKFKEWVSGYGNAIMATDRFLFVASPQNAANWWSGNSDIQVFDISAPDGSMQALSTIHATGRVKDKFKMNLDGAVFTAVTESSDKVLKTQVETFSLADPRNPKALGNLLIIEREQLHATRFAGSLLYAVTFMRVDPLWIIDLSDPSRPKKVGELEIPGWSTYIEPLDGRLLTIGVDNTEGWRIAVQLFDVENPAKPSLLKKVVLGEQYSSSEANQDEKAFGFLPDQNLILVPYSTWSNGKSFQGVHLIDIMRDTLTKRGAIEHKLQARRATVHRDRIVSISGLELLSVDARDRDHPKVVSTTELSFSADRVFLQGQHLVELAAPWGEPVALRVSLADDPTKLLKKVTLSDLPFLGATLRDQRLYVIQGKSTEVIWPQIWNPTNYAPVATNQANLTLSVYDLRKLPEIGLLGQTQTAFENKYWNNLEPLWPKSGVLAWSSTQGGYWFARGGPIAVDAGVGIASAAPTPGIADARLIGIPWWGGYDSTFVAYEVSESQAPQFVSEVNLRGTNNWWNFGAAFTTDGFVYISHQSSEFNKEIRPPPFIYQKWDGTKMITVTNNAPPGAWVQRYYLDVINYNNPKSPSLRKPVNIPGSLIGVAQKGTLLFTQAYRYKDLNAWSGWSESLDASAYDGVEAHLVDLLPLPTAWPHPLLVQDNNIFLGRPAETTTDTSNLEVWTLANSGKFTRIGSTQLKSAAQSFQAFGKLMAVQLDAQVQLFNATNPSSLTLSGSGAPGGCIGYNLKYADGDSDRGLWVPLGPYGVTKINLKP